MGCSNFPVVGGLIKAISYDNNNQNQILYNNYQNQSSYNNNQNHPSSNYIIQNQNKQITSKEPGKFDPFGEKIDLSNPFKELNLLSKRILFLKSGKILLSDSEGDFYLYNDLNFENPYIAQIFDDYPQDMVELSDGSIAACSNDKTLKLFSFQNNTHKILINCQCNDQLWSLTTIKGTDNLVFGDLRGNLFFYLKSKDGYSPAKKIQIAQGTVLNLLSLSENILFVVIMGLGIYFLDINTFSIIKCIKHAYFNPFKDSIQIISDHELVIGAEEHVFLIDYKNYKTLKYFVNDNSYSICKYSEDCLLCNYRDGFIKTYKMIRRNGELKFVYKNIIKIHNKQIVGMVKCPDGKFITYSMDKCLKIWKPKNNSQ